MPQQTPTQPTPNVAGMVADPDFQGLAPADKRAALGRLTGDASFGSLSDAETMQFISRFGAQKPQPIADKSTISAPKTDLDFSSPSALGESLAKPIRNYVTEAQNLTQQGQAAQPIKAAIGKMAGFAFGGSQGIGKSQEGVLTNPLLGTIMGVGPGGAAEAIASKIPSAARAGQTLGAVRAAIESHPVDVSEAGNSALRAWELGRLGGGKIRAVEDFVRRVANPDQGPLTFGEARDIYSQLKPSIIERLSTKGPVQAALADFKVKLGQALENAAGQAGKLQQYQQAMKEYHQAATVKKVAVGAGAVAAKELLPFGAMTEWLRYRLGAK